MQQAETVRRLLQIYDAAQHKSVSHRERERERGDAACTRLVFHMGVGVTPSKLHENICDMHMQQ